jgi:hypothetical protein
MNREFWSSDWFFDLSIEKIGFLFFNLNPRYARKIPKGVFPTLNGSWPLLLMFSRKKVRFF